MSSDFNNVLGGLAREREARAAVRAGGEMSLGRKASGAPTAPPTALKREVVDLTADPDDDKPTKRAKSGASCTTSPISSSSAVSNSVGQPNATIGYAPLVDWRTARPWFCFGCMTPNPADANLACINCQQVKPEMQAWITSQTRLIESFWSPDIVKGSFGKVGMQYGNRGRIRNGNLDPDTACSVYGNSEHVGFGKEPLPLAGDTIAVLRPGRMYPDIMISPTTAKIYKTPATVSNARIERIDYGGPRPFYVFRNADGRNGLEMARLFEQVFGVDILSAEPLGIHCGALGTGSACADKFQKVFPRGMGLDYSRGQRMGDFLTKLLDIVESRYGRHEIVDKGTGKEHMQMQVLSYKPGRAYETSGDYHPHLDGSQTGWVAIASIGYGVDFCVDNSLRCHKYFHEGSCPATGVRQGPQKDNMKNPTWKSQACPNCQLVNLRSGDIVLFHGHPSSRCCHGVLGTRRDQLPPPGLPAWARKCRMSFQVRNMSYGDRPRKYAQTVAELLNETV